MKRFSPICLAALWVAWAVVAHGTDVPLNPNRNVTFISTSDSHFRTAENPTNNEWDHETIDQMNKVTELTWPETLGGDAVEKPRGVTILGDCIDDGDMKKGGKSCSAEQYGNFLKEFGLDGTDGFVKYPVFEGWGNHDGPPIGQEKNGFSFQAQLKKRNQIRLQKGLISNVSANGLHYSWDWDDVHFVQLNLYVADQQNPKVRYSPVWHDPQGSLRFMKEDLAKNVGTSGRPVVLMAHCGFDTDWWIDEDWKQAYDAAKGYNVIAYLYGHSGTGLREWAPPGETKKWTCINDGQTTAGFFLIQIKGQRLRAAYRIRQNIKIDKAAPNKAPERTWDGTWTWKWSLDKNLDGAAKPPAKAIKPPKLNKPATGDSKPAGSRLLSESPKANKPAPPAASGRQAGSAQRDLTFFVVSDTHYGLSEEGDKTLPQLVEKMNQLAGAEYPAAIGAGKVGVPRGVLHIGDITNDAKESPWTMFVRDYGLTGKDGRLAFPVYETFGNHDGGDKNVVRKAIKERNRGRIGLTEISENGLHYSWDWDGIHFLSLGVQPGTTASPYDPEHSIEFAAQDLKKHIGASRRPVILLHHFGFDRPYSLSWWPDERRDQYYQLIKDYNVIAIIHGHAHIPWIYQWRGIDVYHPPHFRQKGPKNTGPVSHGFFVFHIAGDEMTVAERKLDDSWGMTDRKSLVKPRATPLPPPPGTSDKKTAQAGPVPIAWAADNDRPNSFPAPTGRSTMGFPAFALAVLSDVHGIGGTPRA